MTLQPGIANYISNRWKIGGIFLIILVAIVIVARLFLIGAPDLPSAEAQYGEFTINLKETGKLRAENSVTITAPPIRMNLQIIDLVPEGTVVEEGDFLVQFDTTEMAQRIDELKAELNIAQSNLTRSLASMRSNMASLMASVENARASYRLAELRMEQLKFEADIRIEEGRLNLLQSKLSLDQTLEKVEAQRKIDAEDSSSLAWKIRQAELDLERAQRDMDKLTITAPGPGLVVYKEIWKGGDMTKIKIGDTPWRGMALLEIPDLSIMLVETSVNEVDVAKVDTGKKALIELDAYPEPVFHGRVIDVATMATENRGSSDERVFDVQVRIDESDKLLKPGMSASVEIIVDTYQNKVYVPIESVFTRDGKNLVYVDRGSRWKGVEVEIGPRNDNFVIIEEGVEEGGVVSLIDPTTDYDLRTKLDTNGQKDKEDDGKNLIPNKTIVD